MRAELERGGGQQREVGRGRGQRGREHRVSDGLRRPDTLGRILRYAANYQVLEKENTSKACLHNLKLIFFRIKPTLS